MAPGYGVYWGLSLSGTLAAYLPHDHLSVTGIRDTTHMLGLGDKRILKASLGGP
jgi:hypothetical protein